MLSKLDGVVVNDILVDGIEDKLELKISCFKDKSLLYEILYHDILVGEIEISKVNSKVIYKQVTLAIVKCLKKSKVNVKKNIISDINNSIIKYSLTALKTKGNMVSDFDKHDCHVKLSFKKPKDNIEKTNFKVEDIQEDTLGLNKGKFIILDENQVFLIDDYTVLDNFLKSLQEDTSMCIMKENHKSNKIKKTNGLTSDFRVISKPGLSFLTRELENVSFINDDIDVPLTEIKVQNCN